MAKGKKGTGGGIEVGGKLRRRVKLSETQVFLQDKSDEVNKSLLKACERGNPTALRLFFELTQQLTKVGDRKAEISADEYYKVRQEAIKRVNKILPGAPEAVEEVTDGSTT